MKTSKDINHNWLVKRYHILCRKLQLGRDETNEILSAKGVSSSEDMDNNTLIEVNLMLERLLKPPLGETEEMRRKVITSMGKFLKLFNRDANEQLIKVMASVESGFISFNEIPLPILQKINREYRKKLKDFNETEEIIARSKRQNERRIEPLD